MADAFERMHQRLFARLGQEAFLRGLPVIVILEHGVAVTGEYGSIAGYRSFATIPADMAPTVGDALTSGGKSWTVDAINENDGHTVSVVLR